MIYLEADVADGESPHHYLPEEMSKIDNCSRHK